MFESAEKLQEFMTWCKANKVKSFKNKDIEFELSELAFIPDNADVKEIKLEDEKTFADSDNMTREEYEELLFHSSN